MTNDLRANAAMAAFSAKPLEKTWPREVADVRASLLTQTGVLVGTPFYMAPELGYGSKNALPSSDIFSLGVIAFELLMGTRPYSFPPVLGGVIDANALESLQRCPGLRVDLAALFARCVDANPERRPTAGDVARNLAQT
jgi:serine/threonine protein kinase